MASKYWYTPNAKIPVPQLASDMKIASADLVNFANAVDNTWQVWFDKSVAASREAGTATARDYTTTFLESRREDVKRELADEIGRIRRGYSVTRVDQPSPGTAQFYDEQGTPLNIPITLPRGLSVTRVDQPTPGTARFYDETGAALPTVIDLPAGPQGTPGAASDTDVAAAISAPNSASGSAIAALERSRGVFRVVGGDVADAFTRPDSTTLGNATTGQVWSSTGNQQIKSSTLQNAGTAQGLATVPVASPDYTVEAEIAWTGSPGCGVLVAYTDASNYAMAILEGSDYVRLYESKAGVLTKLGEIQSSWPAGPYSTLTVIKTGATARVLLNGQHLFIGTLTANLTAKSVGLRTIGNASTNALHKCRSFKVIDR